MSAPSSCRMFDGMILAVRRDLVRHVDVIALGLLAQNGLARLEIGLLDIGEQPPLESRAQTVLQRLDVLGRPVARDHELFGRLVQRVEGVEELFLRLLFALEELDVVDEQHVDGPVAVAELDRLVVLDRRDELVGEGLRGDVDHPRFRIGHQDPMADGVHEVRLAQPDRPIDEERIVRSRGRVGHRLGGCVREPVGRPDDELLEGVAIGETGMPEILRDGGR
jgi:hypothetical protein